MSVFSLAGQLRGAEYFCPMAKTRQNEDFTPLGQLGEFSLIEKLTADFPLRQSSSLRGIGDDAAVFEHLTGPSLISTDLLIEGVHFDLSYMPPEHLGYKAVSVNLSDIYAMNAQPTQITVSIAASNRFGLEFLERIYAGIRQACLHHEVDLVGGDTSSSYSGLMLSITAIGSAAEKDIVYRDGARENDLLVVSGDLGGAYIGLQILEREKKIFEAQPDMQPELSGHDYVIGRLLKPEARRDIQALLQKLEVKPTSMIDISDGLSSEVLHLAKSSGLGVQVFEDKIPISKEVFAQCEEMQLNATTIALSGGEDYELLFSIPLSDHDKIKGNPHLSVIGHFTGAGQASQLITRDGQAIPLRAQGWNAYSDAESAP